jgi:hypothetical protein
MFKKLFKIFKKAFTHNRCDTCGLTKDEVYVTGIFGDGGIVQCQKCIDECERVEKSKKRKNGK